MKRKQIENYLENECAFRDYRFKSARFFGKTSIARSINLLNPTQHDLDDALSVFCRDGYGVIIIYLGKTERELILQGQSELCAAYAKHLSKRGGK